MTKDETTITVVVEDVDVEKIKEFIVSPNELWYIGFKVGAFIEKKPTKLRHIPNGISVTYERHPEQIGSVMKSQNMEAQKAINKGAGKIVKKRKI